MILLSALLLLAAAPEAPASGADEITVIGQRLATAAVMVSRDAQGRLSCDLSQSTGNDGLDRALCKTAATCVKKGAETADAVGACVDARKPHLLDDVRAAMKDSAKGGRA